MTKSLRKNVPDVGIELRAACMPRPTCTFVTRSYVKVIICRFAFVTSQELDRNLPVERPDFEKLNNPPQSGVQAMWIGHASVLVQIDGLSVLTDPIFSARCSPSQWFGAKRFRDPPCTIDGLYHVQFF